MLPAAGVPPAKRSGERIWAIDDGRAGVVRAVIAWDCDAPADMKVTVRTARQTGLGCATGRGTVSVKT